MYAAHGGGDGQRASVGVGPGRRRSGRIREWLIILLETTLDLKKIKSTIGIGGVIRLFNLELVIFTFLEFLFLLK